MEIRQQLITSTKANGPGVNPVNFITVHETGNRSEGADAAGHANWISTIPYRYRSWHWTVDDHEAVQHYDNKRRCWHAGDGLGKGNYESIGVEICVNSDGDFALAVKNAAHLVAELMKDHDVPLSRVVQHNHWSGKNCPTNLRNPSIPNWNDFLAQVKANLQGTEVSKPVAKPSPPTGTDTQGLLDVDGWWGKDTTRALQNAFGTPTDGIVSNQNVRWRDANPGLTSGWDWLDPRRAFEEGGSTVMKAAQAWAAVPRDDRDGILGPQTIEHIQRKLKIMGLYALSVDGKISKRSQTVKGLQRALNKKLI